MTTTNTINPFKDDMTGRLLLGRYRVVRRLAAGGMGVVYLARAEGAAGFVKPVVVKLVLPILASSEEFSGMFAREARILANLRHPGIVSIVEFAEEADCNIMVLEYVHGFQLGQWKKYLSSKHREIPTAVAIQIIINVLDALHYAHTLQSPAGDMKQIIHRDISPGNIMIDVDGHVKLVDFGIAFATENTEGYKTTNKSFKGKLSYSAPELFANKKASVQSDIYSAGVTLHEILVGRNEFNFKDHASIVNAVLNHVPSSVHACRNDAPERIDDVIWKALAKKSELRFKTAAEFADALRDITSTPEHKASAMLADIVLTDFGEEMAAFLKVESLVSRERAWRTPSIIPPSTPTKVIPQPFNIDPDMPMDGPHSFSGIQSSVSNASRSASIPRLPPELATTGAGEQLTPLSRSVDTGVGAIKPLLYVIVILLVLTIGGIGVFLYMTKSVPESGDRFLVVQSSLPEGVVPVPVRPGADTAPDTAAKAPETNNTDPRPDPDTAAPDTEASAISANETASKDDASPKRRYKGAREKEDGRPDLQELTGAFRKKKPLIHKCFEDHPASVEQSSNVSVLFSVLPSGQVEKVQLSPASLNGTPLGGCLVGVSKSTVFPPQSAPISFRIPLSAKRVKP